MSLPVFNLVYDREIDATYIKVSPNRVAQTAAYEGVGFLLHLDLDKDDKVVGLEFIGAGPIRESSLKIKPVP